MAEGRSRGRPPGSTNKKPRPPSDLNPAEALIMKRLEEIVEAMVDKAVDDKDVNAAKYLIDRVLGKPAERVSIDQQTEQRIVVEYPDDWRKS